MSGANELPVATQAEKDAVVKVLKLYLRAYLDLIDHAARNGVTFPPKLFEYEMELYLGAWQYFEAAAQEAPSFAELQKRALQRGVQLVPKVSAAHADRWIREVLQGQEWLTILSVVKTIAQMNTLIASAFKGKNVFPKHAFWGAGKSWNSFWMVYEKLIEQLKLRLSSLPEKEADADEQPWDQH